MTDPVNLFDLASRQAQWLAARQSAVAGNIANANTPGFVAKDVKPFAEVLARSTPTPVSVAATEGGHWRAERIAFESQDPATAVLPSGNTVAIEDELVKAGEVRRAFEINTAVVKAFHRMLMMSAKG
ncbi:MAG TPA: flagellar basal body rod protein FlgB [Mesorhizobium sp.]|nr:flagellar basal body rod protein FlgB [Mesorhizobium sp.]